MISKTRFTCLKSFKFDPTLDEIAPQGTVLGPELIIVSKWKITQPLKAMLDVGTLLYE